MMAPPERKAKLASVWLFLMSVFIMELLFYTWCRVQNVNYGYGVIGNLAKAMSPNNFLNHVSKCLKSKNVRYTKGTGKSIKKVAVCGGSGSDLLWAAIGNDADANVKEDIKYHSFQEAEDKILYIDAGHYETEIHSLNVVKRKLESLIKLSGESVNVFKFSGSTNPVKYFNNKG